MKRVLDSEVWDLTYLCEGGFESVKRRTGVALIGKWERGRAGNTANANCLSLAFSFALSLSKMCTRMHTDTEIVASLHVFYRLHTASFIIIFALVWKLLEMENKMKARRTVMRYRYWFYEEWRLFYLFLCLCLIVVVRHSGLRVPKWAFPHLEMSD